MIYTVTLNPSIDYILKLDELGEGKLNRSIYDKKIAGGKGIMVSKLLNNMGVETNNLGFLGGYTGDFIRNELKLMGIEENFTEIKEDTRINIKLKSSRETEINARGPSISEDEVEEFLALFDKMTTSDFVVLSGSLPSTLSSNIYERIIKKLKEKGLNFIIDTTKSNLYNSLKYKPVLIKPNIKELQELFDRKIDSLDQIVEYGEKCLALGAENIIVSLGGEGAVFLSENERYFAPALDGRVINSVGSGDAMVGGYVYGIVNKFDKKESFRIAVATGTATAFSEDIASREYIERTLENVELIQL